MRFRSALRLITLALFLALFLTPLYAVYAQDRPNAATRSAAPKLDARALNNLERQKERLQTAKQRIESQFTLMRTKIASREAQFKLRVDQFVNRVKADVALKVNQALNRINQNQTQQMNTNLVRMNGILDKVVTRVGGTASESAQVGAAKSALETAHNAVELQAGKDYTINVSTESAIRKDAQTAREKLQTDLKATRETVRSAKQAVMTAIRGLLGGGNEATRSATQSGLPVN